MRMPRIKLPQGGPPPGAGKPAGRPNGRVGFGLLLIGTGRAAGFAQFGASVDAFLASLAPLLGCLIVSCGVLAWYGHPLAGLSAFLTGVCGLLAPAIIADGFCRAWQRRQHWPLYANVLNCAQWLMLAVLVLLLPLASTCVAAGLPVPVAVGSMMGALLLYMLWFNWFTARHVLDLSAGRAAVLTLAVVFGTGALLQLPGLLTGTPPVSIRAASGFGGRRPGPLCGGYFTAAAGARDITAGRSPAPRQTPGVWIPITPMICGSGGARPRRGLGQSPSLNTLPSTRSAGPHRRGPARTRSAPPARRRQPRPAPPCGSPRPAPPRARPGPRPPARSRPGRRSAPPRC